MDSISQILNYKDKNDFLKTWYRQRSFFTTAHLKYIAIIAMLLSHISQTGFLYMLGADYYQIAGTFTLIGRIAMPIFCFFTVQAVIFTKDIKKYFTRMLLFALVSEVPFDLAFREAPVYWESQNVIFTLLIGAIAIYLIDLIWKSDNHPLVKFIAILLVACIMPILANVMRTDYSSKGVIAIILMYLARNSKVLTCIAILIGFYFEFIMPGGFTAMTYGVVYLSIPLILLYNAQKGKQNRWVFYIFYPTHLFILYLLKLLII